MMTSSLPWVGPRLVERDDRRHGAIHELPLPDGDPQRQRRVEPGWPRGAGFGHAAVHRVLPWLKRGLQRLVDEANGRERWSRGTHPRITTAKMLLTDRLEWWR